MKRVLIYSYAYYPHVGGAEVAIKEITDRITDCDFDLITYNLSGERQNEKIGRVNVYRISAPTKYLFPLLSLVKGVLLHKKNEYDSVWAMMANTGFAALGLKLLYPKINFVLSIQEGDPIVRIKKRVWFVYPIFKMIFRRADIVTTLSNYLADFARSMGARVVQVVPNGVDLYKFKVQSKKVKDLKDEKITLITTSRLVKKNAVGDVVKALKFLPENIVFKSIGSGEDEKYIRRLISSLGLENRVELLPYAHHDELAKHLRGADIFIRPSLSEGLGNSFLEAMAVGLPIIGTNVGGIPDFLTDGKTGLFCNVSDPADIAQKVLTLIDDPDLYSKIAINGRKLIEEKYNWDLIAKRFSGLF